MEDVNPGDQIDITLEFQAPEPAPTEKLVAFYKLVHGISKKFGPKIWVDVKVVQK
jgi:hypothetical protein